MTLLNGRSSRSIMAPIAAICLVIASLAVGQPRAASHPDTYPDVFHSWNGQSCDADGWHTTTGAGYPKGVTQYWAGTCLASKTRVLYSVWPYAYEGAQGWFNSSATMPQVRTLTGSSHNICVALYACSGWQTIWH